VFTNLTNPTYVYAKLPTKPKMGAGWAEAPRGALGHWITIEKKRIVNYQCVVPSTWNHSPKHAGVGGAAEQVVQSVSGLVTTIAAAGTDAIYISLLRLMHQWDFCIACAVHVVKPDGSTVLKFKMETDGRVTKLPNDAEI
jgi:hydrogenase large subunit